MLSDEDKAIKFLMSVKAEVIEAALGICALPEKELFQRLEKLYMKGVDAGVTLGVERATAALSKPASEDAREGFVSVPVEPTEAMLDAAEKLDWSNEDIRGNCCNMFQVMIAVAVKGDGK